MKKIALLLTLAAFLGPIAPWEAAGDRAALPLLEIPAESGKDKEKQAKKGHKEKADMSAPPAAVTALKSCCAKPSRQAALTAKPSAPVRKP